jgi:CheY-like chemotaxis protein
VAKRILVIDDEDVILEVVRHIFEDMGHVVTTHSDPAAGIKDAIDTGYDLIMTDLRMPTLTGLEVTRRILGARPGARILVVTAFPADPLASEALAAGALALVRKPFEIAKVLDYLEGA